MEKLKIGKIVGTHALKGELKIRSFSDFNDQRFVVGHKLYLNEIVDPFIIKTVRVHKGNYLISFEGLQDINLVEKYVGYNVYGLKEDVELDGKNISAIELNLFVGEQHHPFARLRPRRDGRDQLRTERRLFCIFRELERIVFAPRAHFITRMIEGEQLDHP